MLNDAQVKDYFDKYVKDKDHAVQVARLSLKIFECLNEQLKIFDAKDAELLEIAALLHDMGYSFGNKSHNKNGRDFIMKNNILRFSLQDNAVIANIIRYHRGKLPNGTHTLFMNLDLNLQYKVAILSGICRLSDGLDASHLGAVRDIEMTYDQEAEKYILKVFSDNPRVKKIITAKEKRDLLVETLKKKISIVV